MEFISDGDNKLKGVIFMNNTTDTINIPTYEEFYNHHEECFNELPKDILIKSCKFLNDDYLSDENIEQLKEIYNKCPSSTKSLWFIEYHNYEGMYIRNFLREKGLLDNQLPSGNWDDYYTQCLECAIGVRKCENNM